MKRFLYASAIIALLANGCGSPNIPHRPAGLPIRYHNKDYDFTCFLPANWRGYSVVTQQWNAATVDQTTVWHGPIIVLRHPQWKADDPCQDIPILVFTRSQWEDEKAGRFTIGAGGLEEEIEHNQNYVFAVHTRFNWAEFKGWLEAGKIVEKNRVAHAPHLHPI
jgi:hypothetical protein